MNGVILSNTEAGFEVKVFLIDFITGPRKQVLNKNLFYQAVNQTSLNLLPILLMLALAYNFGGLRPTMKNITARIRPTTKRIHATSEAIAAIPVRPNIPATRATTRNIKAQ